MSPTLAGQVERRVLGGFFFADAITGASIVAPLTITNTKLQLKVNNSGVFAIFDAPGFSQLTTEFDLRPDWPTSNGPSFEITVQDPSLRYLARRAEIVAPQAVASVTTRQQVTLYPGPSGGLEPNWAVMRVAVKGTSGAGLPFAVVQAIRSDDTVAATGMTDSRGQALLAVPGLGVQVSADSSGSVTEITIPITIQAWFDPSVSQQPPGWIPNPDDILGNLSNASLKTGTTSGAIGPRQTLFATIGISV